MEIDGHPCTVAGVGTVPREADALEVYGKTSRQESGALSTPEMV